MTMIYRYEGNVTPEGSFRPLPQEWLRLKQNLLRGAAAFTRCGEYEIAFKSDGAALLALRKFVNPADDIFAVTYISKYGRNVHMQHRAFDAAQAHSFSGIVPTIKPHEEPLPQRKPVHHGSQASNGNKPFNKRYG